MAERIVGQESFRWLGFWKDMGSFEKLVRWIEGDGYYGNMLAGHTEKEVIVCIVFIDIGTRAILLLKRGLGLLVITL